MEANVNTVKIPMKMTRENIQALAGNEFFGVTFVKRTNKELRSMQCRLHVKKHLKGGDKPFSDKEKELLTVYSLDARGYRSFGLEAVTEIRAGGKVYVPEGAKA